MESGVYSHIWKEVEPKLKQMFKDKHIIPWRVYTPLDLELASPKDVKDIPSKWVSSKSKLVYFCRVLTFYYVFFAGNIAEAFNRRVGGVVREYTHSIMRQLATLREKLDTMFYVVHTLRVGNKPNHRLGRLVSFCKSFLHFLCVLFIKTTCGNKYIFMYFADSLPWVQFGARKVLRTWMSLLQISSCMECSNRPVLPSFCNCP